MRIRYLHIKNYKSIRDLEISDIENAMILVGKNNTGKTVVIDAIRVAAGISTVTRENFARPDMSISIEVRVEFQPEDLLLFHRKGLVSKYKRYEIWERDFKGKLPSFAGNELHFTCIITPELKMRYNDGTRKHNPYIREVFPKVYHIDQQRNLSDIQDEVFRFYDRDSISSLKENACMFNSAKKCNRCFNCIGLIQKKTPEELNICETAKLLEYKVFRTNINTFSEKLNRYFHANGSGFKEIHFELNFNPEEMFKVKAQVYDNQRKTVESVATLSEGLRSIYALSLLEAYVEEEGTIPCIILMEDPEIYLHPQLQKTASEILCRLSKKNQVIFSTHSPNMIFNFSTRQIKQVILDEQYCTVVQEETDIDEILDDLGYTANDFLNVSFVFIVEGKQDKSRLPLLLEKYYSEIKGTDGELKRISIIATNSCTNIKTYANLKYMNQLYLREQFLMIRDGDGKDPEELKGKLCSYYKARGNEEMGNLPRVQPRNVLILKYYSFENYFLNPEVMAKIGVVPSKEAFYDILYEKFKEYLYRLESVRHMEEMTGVTIQSKEDVRMHMEEIKTYVRGHNLYDIFYGRYRAIGENEILRCYIEAAPREDFKDILDAIDSFVYFDNRQIE